MAKDVFISYAAEDKQVASAICSALESKGDQCWMAPRDILPGATYAEALIHAIDASKIMVLVFSSNANTSPHILREVERAVHNNLTIIPFRIDNSKPSDAMLYYISAPQWLNASEPPLEKHLDLLVNTIKSYLSKKSEMEAPSPIPSSQLTTRPDIPPPHPATRLLKPTSKTFFIVFVMIIAIVIISVYFASVMGGIDNSTKLSSITPSPTIKVNTIKPTSVPTTSTPVHFISAALQASELDLGDTLVVSGTAEGATSVTITITTFPTGEVILRNSYVVLPDGSYEARIKLDTFSSGRYYMYAELPTGENTKLSFSIL